MKKKTSKRKLTPEAKKAKKYNQILKKWTNFFGKEVKKSVLFDVLDIEGIQVSSQGVIKKGSFEGEDAIDIEKELKRKLKNPEKIKQKLIEEINKSRTEKGKQALKRFTKENLSNQFLAKTDLDSKFEDVRDRFYQFMKTNTFKDLYGVDDQVTAANDALYHEGRFESYTDMLEAINKVEEVLRIYGF